MSKTTVKAGPSQGTAPIHDPQATVPDGATTKDTPASSPGNALVARGEVIDYAADAGDLGFSQQDTTLPFLRVLQSNSPQLARGNAKHVPGAQSGDFFNSVTHEVFKGEPGVFIVPVAFQRSYTEWKPRESGGGMVADHGADDAVLRECTQDERRRWWTPRGTIINEAGHYFSFRVDPESGEFEMCIVPFASTQWKKARTWNTVMSGLMVRTPDGMKSRPMFSSVYHFTTVPESNESGDWMGYKIRRHGDIHGIANGREIYEAARGLKAMVLNREVKAAHEDPGDAQEPANRGGGGPRASAPVDDDIPF